MGAKERREAAEELIKATDAQRELARVNKATKNDAARVQEARGRFDRESGK
jgi:hypothetical protein